MDFIDSCLVKYGAVLNGYAILGIPMFGPNAEKYKGSIYGNIDYNGTNNFIVSIINVDDSKIVYTDVSMDNKFVFLNVKAGFYKIFAYENINSISDTYFNGSIDPLKYAAKFNFYNEIIEVRHNWDLEGITLIIN